MTQAEYLTSIEDSTSTLEVLSDVQIAQHSDNTTERQALVLTADDEGFGHIESIQYFVFNNEVYPRGI